MNTMESDMVFFGNECRYSTKIPKISTLEKFQ